MSSVSVAGLLDASNCRFLFAVIFVDVTHEVLHRFHVPLSAAIRAAPMAPATMNCSGT